MTVRACLALLAALAAAPASAEVVESVPTGFTSRSEALVARPPAALWAALLQWGRWWDPAHSYSGKPGALLLEPRANGTLAESWDGGSVLHATVLNAMPPRLLRLQGGFGPLQALPVNAILDFTLKPEGQATRLTMTYRVGGPPQTRLPDLAAPVDAVMSAGFARLVRFAQTGTPEESR
jgi:uncharacterized protein YndB with AHSA1/START domain